jgi:hypothetical protein
VDGEWRLRETVLVGGEEQYASTGLPAMDLITLEDDEDLAFEKMVDDIVGPANEETIVFSGRATRKQLSPPPPTDVANFQCTSVPFTHYAPPDAGDSLEFAVPGASSCA